MPLSEHEQRMLDQIESALYAEDPKFASTVRGGRMRAASSRRRFQAIALFVLGLVLLIAGVALPIKPGGFPVISLIGFIVMFGAGVLLLWGGGKNNSRQSSRGGSTTPDETKRSDRGKPRGGRKSGGFSSRMEDRFKKRFEQE
ncbi:MULTISPECIES: DUF3040 domain-containing protein [Rhodococcus]|uniref:DUF3040 domain-containing protein n=1 Tax=Rhodococcus oxybenzonivorans TaxID=1990687 RepID=A0AAE4UVF1_9NOCA|nr:MULTISPECIES: DUF3040 domain-containing protein [Rhodococcus]MDV7244176.1 DUF3040 domain-containing protein [Rhodococcus oxybenzonivorans]MDV7263043.1 DUF3040 domain-containing protein [Rhodococcus oxybenzonivorans]MDV7274582.1 DUF3040 domain-containing protein [Rhodococcus oxybenzonivorans]MDV7335895.1 DUF3040 domain-containing protein [Rhodococcus oxybenzonivorans]MDV7345532.1 DUF3040 domain-containing protein [Rhodococcus oxybenzonivorans]